MCLLCVSYVAPGSGPTRATSAYWNAVKLTWWPREVSDTILADTLSTTSLANSGIPTTTDTVRDDEHDDILARTVDWSPV